MLKKTYLLVAGAMFLIIGAMASSASAATFTSESSKTNVSIAQTGFVITTDTGEVKCPEASYTGVVETKAFESVNTASFVPYFNCSIYGFTMAITSNGCTHRFNANGTLDLVCPAGQSYVFDSGFNACNLRLPPQTGLSAITYSNGSSGGKADVTGEIKITNLEYEESGFACASPGKVTSNGQFTGKITITGKDTGNNSVGVSWDE